MAANLDGMSLSDLPLAEASGLTTVDAAEAWAREHGIPPDDRSDRMQRLQRLAAAARSHPDIVCPELGALDAAKYWHQFYLHAPILAHTLSDISEPARVEPMRIRTFGTPVHRPPIRLPPT